MSALHRSLHQNASRKSTRGRPWSAPTTLGLLLASTAIASGVAQAQALETAAPGATTLPPVTVTAPEQVPTDTKRQARRAERTDNKPRMPRDDQAREAARGNRPLEL